MPNISSTKNESINNNSIANKVIEGSEFKNIDFRMLRSFRVLRPLKLVSRTPSKYIQNKKSQTATTNNKQIELTIETKKTKKNIYAIL